MRRVHRTDDDIDDMDRLRESSVVEERDVERHWAFGVSDIFSLAAGLFFAVIGIIALIDLGFDDFPSEATTEVLGLAHTQIIAIASIVLGLLFLAGVGGYGRSMTMFASAVAVVVGIVVLATREEFDPEFVTNEAYGWTALVIGLVVMIAAIVVPSMTSHRGRVVDRTV